MIKKDVDKSLHLGAPGGIRTPDLPVRSRTLYPTKLLVHSHIYYKLSINNIQEFFIFFSKNPCIFKKYMLYCISSQKYRGVAQLVARVVWDHEVAGSIPVTSTILESLKLSFF